MIINLIYQCRTLILMMFYLTIIALKAWPSRNKFYIFPILLKDIRVELRRDVAAELRAERKEMLEKLGARMAVTVIQMLERKEIG